MSPLRGEAPPPGPTAASLTDGLTAALGTGVVEVGAGTDGTVVVRVAREAWRAAAEHLRGAGLTRLEFLTCIDWDDRLALVLQVYAMGTRLVVRLTADVPRDDATVATVSDLWPTAGWEERETYDQFGVVFEGHPDLRRILNPEAWVGHPLRRDYEDHVGITRPQYF